MIKCRVYTIFAIMLLMVFVTVCIIAFDPTFAFTIVNETKDEFTECDMCFTNDAVEIKKSCMGDRGAFATRDITAGELVEACPLVIDARENIPYGSAMDDYVFSAGDGKVAVAFGYCSFFNHDKDPNVTWKVVSDAKRILFTATRDIKKGDEMFVSYGDNYWISRKIQPKTRASSI